ncbi:hypothetical protein [Streptomyces sp. NPDC058157]|uniref:hypothetical protein n=1 Tax=Streptomyces sp. NPDC058157 TaxID=3346360 RepID=UPI0036DFAD26
MSEPTAPAHHARTAAESLLDLNVATLNPDAYTYPGDVHTTAQALKAMSERLPQGLDQLGAALDRHAANGNIWMTDGRALDPALYAAREALVIATVTARTLTAALASLSEHTASMGAPFPCEGGV